MDIYVLNSDFKRTDLIDRYESFIWTERFAAYGDFELKLKPTSAFRSLLREGTRLVIANSTRVMEIETIADDTDDEGRRVVSYTGPTIEKTTLEQRIFRSSMADTTTEPETTLTGLPANVARHIFNTICREGRLSPHDVIPLLTVGSVYPKGTIPEPDKAITVAIKPKTVYAAIKEICDAYGLGFRLVHGAEAVTPGTWSEWDDDETWDDNDDTWATAVGKPAPPRWTNDPKLYFDIYSGNDLTSAQSSGRSVIFSEGLDNLTNISELTSKASYKNVAYVISANGTRMVYSPDVMGTVAGFDRRVLLVEVTDVGEATGDELQDILEQRGLEELAKNRAIHAFDGEVPQNGRYRYNVDYQLGDMVEMRGEDGLAKNMRVAEQIFVSDSNGVRSYPTLTDDLFITPGSWLGWDFNAVWENAQGTWAEA